MSPLIMSHINRTRPRQGLQLVIRRVAGSQISHIFRRASAGSEALPSLARRVSMQQHAELPCRGNKSGSTLFIDANQKSYNQLTANKTTKRDLVLNFRKPKLGEFVITRSSGQ